MAKLDGTGTQDSSLMRWRHSYRADPAAAVIADRHYSRQTVGSPQFVPPGRCFVLVATTGVAYWVTSWPFAEYVKHAWAGAWTCSAFRNEGAGLSSELIREAVAATRWEWPEPPPLGMITFVDDKKTRHKRDPGRCFRKSGFVPAVCPAHGLSNQKPRETDCAACRSQTRAGLFALQLFPERMPPPRPPSGVTLKLFA